MKSTSFIKMTIKLRSVEQKLSMVFEEATGFSLTRYEILVFLRDNGRSLQNEIAYHLELNPAAITRHLKILESKNYVVRQRNEDNGREVYVDLTEFARDELIKCKEQNKEDDVSVVEVFSNEEICQLIEMLEKLEERLK